MRRLVPLTLFAALLLPGAAAAATRATAGDGTFVVKNATGTVTVTVRGALVGHLDRGKVIIDDPITDDGDPPIITGAERHHDLTDTKSVYSGYDVRFKLVGGLYRVKVVAAGVNISAVGKGTTWLDGGPTAADGTYSLDGGPFRSLPDELAGPFVFGG